MGAPGHGALQVHPAILEGEPISVYNHGDMMRDFTYIDDLVEGIFRLIASLRPRG